MKSDRDLIRMVQLLAALLIALPVIQLSPAVFAEDTPKGEVSAKTPTQIESNRSPDTEVNRDGKSLSDPPKLRPWLTNFVEASRSALADHKPLLVRIGGESCAWCKELDAEIAKPEMQAALGDWTLVYLDIDQNEADVRKLGIGPIPALRMFSSEGRLVGSHDGFLPAERFVALLANSKTAAHAVVDEAIFTEDVLNAADVPKLIEHFRSPRPAVRDAALGQLYRHPREARERIIDALFQESLATRLGAFELLDRWKAPLKGIDPWRKETLSDAARKTLTDWLATPLSLEATTAAATPAQLAAAAAAIDRMLTGSEEEAAAIREQLSYLGEALLPDVRMRMSQLGEDQSHGRLSALRYRLLASDSLALNWPTGIDRLASLDSPTRRQAAGELVTRAKSSDKALLAELFSDPDPMVREISLRAIEHVGGSLASETLIKMLADPEPNVRAAILKQLAEKPVPGLIGPVSEYVANEKDPDMIMYAIRFLRTAGSPAARGAIIKLLEHPSWQVRAEAVEALRKDTNSTTEVTQLLDDPEPFVVAKALEVLGNNNMVPTVALIRTADRHPTLAPTVIKMLIDHKDDRPAAAKYLRDFAKNTDPAVRAAAVAGLAEVAPAECEAEITAGLVDDSSKVRIAAAQGVFKLLDDEWPKRFQNNGESDSAGDFQITDFTEEVSGQPSAGPLTRILQFFGHRDASQQTPKTETPSAAKTSTEPPSVAKSAPQSEQAANEAVPGTEAGATSGQVESASESQNTPRNDVDPIVAKTAAIDDWLAKHRQGENRSDWLAKTIPILKNMTMAETADERVAAARTLIPLGNDDAAEQLLTEVISKPTFVPEFAAILHWLPSEKRTAMYEKLLPGVRSNARYSRELLSALGDIRDQTAAQAVWSSLEKIDDVSDDSLSMAYYVARGVYFPQGIYNSGSGESSAQLKKYSRQVKTLKAHAAEGSEAQRLLALTLLSDIDHPTASGIADPMLADAKLSRKMRAHLFRIVLAGLSKQERHQRAIAALASDEVDQRLTALRYLALGSRLGLTDPDNSFYWMSVGEDEEFTAQPFPNMPIHVPFAIKELKPRDVGPLLANPDRETAALAGYLLALMGEPDGLAPLLDYWRTSKQSNDEVTSLVYRALAVTDDARYLPVLEEIYQQLHDSDNIGTFYWTIRIMHCEGILELRARIRKEVDSSKLQSSSFNIGG